MSLANNTLTTSPTSIFTCANAKGTAILAVMFTNYSGAAITLDFHACPGAEGAADENKLLHQLTIPAGETFAWSGDEKMLLDNGDDLKAAASANSSVATTVIYRNL